MAEPALTTGAEVIAAPPHLQQQQHTHHQYHHQQQQHLTHQSAQHNPRSECAQSDDDVEEASDEDEVDEEEEVEEEEDGEECDGSGGNEMPNNNVGLLAACLTDGGCASSPAVSPSTPTSIIDSSDVRVTDGIKRHLVVQLEATEPNGVMKKRRRNNKTDGALSHKTEPTTTTVRVGRGRPPKRPLIATYHSQISGDKNTIKIRIKKAHLGSQNAPAPRKPRQRRRQRRNASDTDASDYEVSTNKRNRATEGQAARSAIESESRGVGGGNQQEQSAWGLTLPQQFLHSVFQQLSNEQGSLPLLVNLCRVCKLWHEVAISSSLWVNVDLSGTVKERSKTDLKLLWLIQNRLTHCQDLNLSDWKIKNIQAILAELCAHCPELRALNLSGWSGLTADNLKYLTSECSKLERLDLSAVNSSNQGTKSALNATPLMSLAQSMSSRLTHLVLAHNKLAGISQILLAIASHCPNLQLLDLSNIKTHASNSSLLQVEKLQEGCPKLRVLRVTNSQISLAPTTLTAQMASPGFPELEELSLAGIEDDQTTSKFIDDNGVERILKSSHKLRLLDVRGCTRITDSGLVKVPAWDLEHLFLSACYVTRLNHSGLELIVQKWSHSLVEVDLAWSTATRPLDAAVMTLAEKGPESPLRILNLCGSSVSLESVKAVLGRCPHIQSINLQSCRALPRGIKRLFEGPAVAELRSGLHEKPKPPPEEREEESREKEGTAGSVTAVLASDSADEQHQQGTGDVDHDDGSLSAKGPSSPTTDGGFQ